ncbi:MAG: Asp23/Gls24 family envelope stress response protein [Oscillospiraceae bacterium]
MGENKEYMTHPEENGSINIAEDVIAAIAASAASEVDGVAGLMTAGGNVADLVKKNQTRGVKLSMEGEDLNLEIYLIVRYGQPIPEVAENVQKAVSSAVEAMSGFTLHAVNVHVGGISLA